MTNILSHWIAGEKYSSVSQRCKDLHNPATGSIIGQVPIADLETCNLAVSAAKKAWPAWSHTTPSKRIQILFQFRNLVDKNRDELAKLVTREHGKTLDDAQGSIARGLEVIEFHCGLLNQIQGAFSADVSQHIDCYTFRQSLGVCAGVSPFNFPIMVPIWMMIPAIACGNTFILKPSEQDPSPCLHLLELFHEAGLPPGVANLVHGDASTVDILIQHPDIAAITAVASTPVAQSIYQKATQAGKRSHTFGGAKNHAVVMPDADFKQAAKALTGAAFGSAGERCMAISALVTVGEKTKEKLLQEMLPEIKKIIIEPGDHPKSELGPLISAAHRQKVLEAINTGVNEGAHLLMDGRDFVHPLHQEGFFLGPCLFDSVTEKMSIYQNEIFGPVLVILQVATLQEAIALVNRNLYGNGTAIFTQDGYCARQYSHEVQVGMVGINVPIPVPIVSHPFGGWKKSSFGDMGMHGTESIHFYTRSKTITSKWVHTQNTSSFVMPENG